MASQLNMLIHVVFSSPARDSSSTMSGIQLSITNAFSNFLKVVKISVQKITVHQQQNGHGSVMVASTQKIQESIEKVDQKRYPNLNSFSFIYNFTFKPSLHDRHTSKFTFTQILVQRNEIRFLSNLNTS